LKRRAAGKLGMSKALPAGRSWPSLPDLDLSAIDQAIRYLKSCGIRLPDYEERFCELIGLMYANGNFSKDPPADLVELWDTCWSAGLVRMTFYPPPGCAINGPSSPTTPKTSAASKASPSKTGANRFSVAVASRRRNRHQDGTPPPGEHAHGAQKTSPRTAIPTGQF
jgi:hypothetical protein